MKVVIVGGGFGGIRAALKLANRPGFEVRLISNSPHFTYHAALYRSATGRSPMEVVVPLADFFKSARNVEVLEDKIVQIDDKGKKAVGESGSKYAYDKLILAVGNVTQYFGIKGLEEFSYGIKTINEALELKRHLHQELAEKTDGRTNYVIVGGGATGVELAAELVSYLNRIRKRHKQDLDYKVALVEAAPKLLPLLPAEFTDKIHRRLEKLGIEVKLNTAVEGEDKDTLDLPGPADIKTHSVVWTAGVTNNPLFPAHSQLFKLGKANRAEVNEYLEGAPNIYVIGDSAQTKYTGMAQTALHDGEFVADNLLKQANGKSPKAYQPKRPVYAIPVGPYWTAALWGKVKIYGFLGYTLRRLADLRLYLKFMSLGKSLTTWRYGYSLEETCPECQ